MSNNDALLVKLLPMFKVEAREHLSAMIACLIELERAAEAAAQKSSLEVLFRETHSLKGAASAVNMADIESLCQGMESVVAALKRDTLPRTAGLFDTLHESLDCLNISLSSIDSEPGLVEKSQYRNLIGRLGALLTGSSAETNVRTMPGAPTVPEKRAARGEELRASAGTVRISTAKLDSLLFQAEELVSSKLAGLDRMDEIRSAWNNLRSWTMRLSRVQGDVRLMRQQIEQNTADNALGMRESSGAKVLEFVEWSESFGKSLETRVGSIIKQAEHDHRVLGRAVDAVVEGLKQVLMLPFSSVLELFPKLVRDVAHDRGKLADLVVNGGEIEVDKRILEEIKDPLIHLLRNAIDHGMETPAERQQAGKPQRGKVTITIQQKDAGKVEVSIADDGAGVNVPKVKATAFRLGLLSEAAAGQLADEEAIHFIFRSEFSTSPLITDLSGRGLGLAIVKEKVEGLGGTVVVTSKAGAGTTFRIVVPLTLARFRGVLVRINDAFFVVPTVHVHQVLRVKRSAVKTAGNRETIELRGQAVALVNLGTVFALDQEAGAQDREHAPAMVLGQDHQRMAFVVDEVVNEQEVLVKSFGKQLSRVRNFAGAAVLGSGKVVPVINVYDLMKSAASAAPQTATAPAVNDAPAKMKSLLVVEDSITARTLLKNILESAGYAVRTAVDGLDGFTTLKSALFDLVISDVEMPRLNGLDLTARIRADSKLADLPVILVTALESREDRERGIDVGANAYIVKSAFDQANLLDAVRRLI